MASKLRILMDANVLVAGIVWPRFPYEVLQHAAKGDYHIVLSPRIIQEAREAIIELAAGRQAVLDTFLRLAAYEPVDTPSDAAIAANRELIRDPKDIHVALAAITSGVDYLITQDKDFTEQNETTVKLHSVLKILLPGTFLRDHMGWTSDALEAIRQRKWSDLKE